MPLFQNYAKMLSWPINQNYAGIFRLSSRQHKVYHPHADNYVRHFQSQLHNPMIYNNDDNYYYAVAIMYYYYDCMIFLKGLMRRCQ